jgi:hypothetical protein
MVENLGMAASVEEQAKAEARQFWLHCWPPLVVVALITVECYQWHMEIKARQSGPVAAAQTLSALEPCTKLKAINWSQENPSVKIFKLDLDEWSAECAKPRDEEIKLNSQLGALLGK